MSLRKLIPTLVILAAIALVGAGQAMAAPVLNLEMHHGPTDFEPGGPGNDYWFTISNVGDETTTGPVTLTVELPSGVALEGATAAGGWSCPSLPGATVVTCTRSSSPPRNLFPRYSVTSGSNGKNLILSVTVDPSLAGQTVVPVATLTGGGSATPATATEPTPIGGGPAPFGIVPGSFGVGFTEADGSTPVRGAGSHPTLANFAFDFNTALEPFPEAPTAKLPAGNVRDLKVDLPPGFFGNPTVVGECTAAQLQNTACPPSSKVGIIDVATEPLVEVLPGANFGLSSLGVYNMVHQPGTVAEFAFALAGHVIHIQAHLDPSRNYALYTEVPVIQQYLPIFFQKLTLWGVPADPSHDPRRCNGNLEGQSEVECTTELPERPFLTLPFQCGGESEATLRNYDSWQNPGVFDGAPIPDRIEGATTGCDRPPFAPTVSVSPTTDAAESPTGLNVNVDVPQHDACDPGPPVSCPPATSPLKDITVSLPEGIAVNPAGANGLAACSPAQISLGTDDPVACPDASKIATAQLTTPVLPNPIEGTVYLAAQGDNPFGSLLAAYLVFSDPDRGLLIKLPGKIDVDPATGQLTTSFKENPELPFSELQLHFKGGAHSTLTTPRSCGEYTSTADLSPWSGTAAVHSSNTFAITQRPGGGACPQAQSALPNSPFFEAGTVSPIAGSYSPFVVNLKRDDATQQFKSITLSPPPGLLAKLAGTPYCPDADLAAAVAKSGHEEEAHPSCPAASKVGGVVVGAGAGPSPFYARGTAYLAGPYKGAPLSLAVVTPATAGPFDLGTIVIRNALDVNLETTRITAVSDPIPEFLQGIPLDVRSVKINLDKPSFTLNPTSCDPMSLGGQVTSTLGQVASLTSPFQIGECGHLAFKPSLRLSLTGPTKRTGHPALKAVLTYPKQGAYANISRAQVNLPHAEFLDQGNIRNTCTKPVLAAGACPPSTVYGKAKAWTPLLEKPLEGPVYLVGGYGYKLPALIAELDGQIRVLLVGKIDTGPNDGIRNTFEAVPDAPVEKFILEMKGGKKRGLLVNSENVCKSPQRAIARFQAQNGNELDTKPLIANSCGKGGGQKKGAKKHHGRQGSHR
jgi:hypothetical protein